MFSFYVSAADKEKCKDEVMLFIIGIIRKESHSKLGLIGSIVCVAGVVAFQIF